ncbi:hypothetical protein ACHQM5_012169 [Ranunculus cassubicifolius]
MRRERDAEAELHLPPGFRFHPTDEELVVHYLCKKISYQTLPVPILAEIDLYKYNPWQLPDMALFGTKEWYFFTPRDRKYPNGSRPNRAAGNGYWKATGADKPIRPAGSAKHVGIKKALVFYSGKAPKGVKTDWIMHEYRLAEPNRTANNKKGNLRLDDWVLCRIYNKKNNWNMNQIVKDESSVDEQTGSDSFMTSESSDVDNDSHAEIKSVTQENSYRAENNILQQPKIEEINSAFQMADFLKEDNQWFTDLNLDDLQNTIPAFGDNTTNNNIVPEMAFQDYSMLGLTSPHFRPYQTNQLPFWSS